MAVLGRKQTTVLAVDFVPDHLPGIEALANAPRAPLGNDGLPLFELENGRGIRVVQRSQAVTPVVPARQ